MNKIIGLDVGTKTIGIALSDGLGMLAHPHSTLSRKSVAKDCDRLLELVREHEVRHIVVGLPYELDGSEARSARLARQIGDALSELSGLSVSYIDERFSSVEAERKLIAAGMKRGRRKQVIDQQAAVGILQGFLDAGGLERGGLGMGE